MSHPYLAGVFESARQLDIISGEYGEPSFVLKKTKNSPSTLCYVYKTAALDASMDNLRLLRSCAAKTTLFSVTRNEADDFEDYSMVITLSFIVPSEFPDEAEIMDLYRAYCAEHPIEEYRQGKNIGDLFIELGEENGFFD